jgi:hypothetical protein
MVPGLALLVKPARLRRAPLRGLRGLTATRAAILGPGEPAATSSVNAKIVNAAAVTADLLISNNCWASGMPAPRLAFTVNFER